MRPWKGFAMSKISRRSLIVGAGAVAGIGLLGRPAIAAPTDIVYVGGVAVRRYLPANPNGRPPIILLHGGAHAGWSWDRYAAHYATDGWTSYAIDWYNHGLSAPLTPEGFIARSIKDVVTEINLVRNALLPNPNRFILMGHSMGAMAALWASQTLRPRGLVLMSPVVPSQVGAAAIEISVDMGQPFPVPPFPIAKAMFYSTMSDAEAMLYYPLLTSESPVAVWEATRWTISVNLASVKAPTMIAEGALDTLTPPAAVQGLANLMDCRYVEWPGIGHADLMVKEQGWLPVAQDIITWLNAL
jgi:pimeloyl-ACP methyl ester carboxylesterase